MTPAERIRITRKLRFLASQVTWVADMIEQELDRLDEQPAEQPPERPTLHAVSGEGRRTKPTGRLRSM